jgi:selenocysteine lyase/cysteine desulfurase
VPSTAFGRECTRRGVPPATVSLLRRYGLEAAVRPSLAMYNTAGEVDLLVAALHRLASNAARRR